MSKKYSVKDDVTEEIVKLLDSMFPFPEPKTSDEIRQEQEFRGAWIQGRVNALYRKGKRQ